ncbi:MAG TPA: hypothetical protein VHZ31_01860 [Solirubrobacteraceae bacterium]|jgi:hypothetical protein|nr:hypothetical protein [Solirubrobacteraceae bacterium]
MSEQEATPVAEEVDATAGADVDAGTADIADAVDDRAAELTGAAGAAATDSPVPDNRAAVADAEEHLEDVDLGEEREALKKLQRKM